MDNPPNWLEKYRPKEFVDRGPELDPIRLARLETIPREYRAAVEEIKAGRLRDGELFRDFRRVWHKSKGSTIITGPRGIGKSTAMAWACIRTIDAGNSIEWINAQKIPEYVTAEKQGAILRPLQTAKTTHLCVIDDAHRVCQHGNKSQVWPDQTIRLTALINDRYEAGLITLLAATCNVQALGKPENLGPDIIDRFPHKITGKGDSMR